MELEKLLSIHKDFFLSQTIFLYSSLKGGFLDNQRAPKMIEITGL